MLNCHMMSRRTVDDIITSVRPQAADPIVPTGSERPPPSRAQHQYTNNMSSIAVHSLLHTPSLPPPSSSSPPLSFPPASTITMEMKPRMDSLKVGMVTDDWKSYLLASVID